MKKIVLASLVVITWGLLLINISYKQFHKKEDIIQNDETKETEPSGVNSLAILVEDDDGNYKLSTSDTWPTEGYEFNATLSKCENGGKLSWNDGKVTLRTSGSDKCYVYFDKERPYHVKCNDNTLACAIAKKQGTQQGEGYLYFHDKAGTLANGAGDDSYRYAGDNPNNFVCVGSTDATCPEENMYRIIGVFPFTSNGEQQTGYTDGMEYRVKSIKSEYVTKEELGNWGQYAYGDSITGLSVYSSYMNIARIQTKSGIHGFLWTTGKNWNDWETATLNQALNDESIGYLHNIGKKWSDQIVPSTWYVSGYNTEDITARQVRDAEMGSSKTVKEKVGLMYVSDYGFAASEEHWTETLYYYDLSVYDNWLFNGVNEWLISPVLNGYNPFYVAEEGFVVGIDGLDSHTIGVRPSFYLESSTMISSDGNDGSHGKPYRIVLN